MNKYCEDCGSPMEIKLERAWNEYEKSTGAERGSFPQDRGA